MSLLRTIKCTVCGDTCTEETYGVGFPGWCIIKGIAEKEPEEGVPLTDDNMTSYLCSHHKAEVSSFITDLVDGYNDSVIEEIDK